MEKGSIGMTFHPTYLPVSKEMDFPCQFESISRQEFPRRHILLRFKTGKECFWWYITNKEKDEEVFFTGMFTSNRGDLSIQYYDHESGRIRHYYLDFLAKMTDGRYQRIEVKGDDKIDDVVVKAKGDAARELAAKSIIDYIVYAGSQLMSSNVSYNSFHDNNS